MPGRDPTDVEVVLARALIGQLQAELSMIVERIRDHQRAGCMFPGLCVGDVVDDLRDATPEHQSELLVAALLREVVDNEKPGGSR